VEGDRTDGNGVFLLSMVFSFGFEPVAGTSADLHSEFVLDSKKTSRRRMMRAAGAEH
jgi:hypothetical protein